MLVKTKVQVEGTATVRIPDGLSPNERKAAEAMALTVANMQLLSISTTIASNDEQFNKWATDHNITVQRAKEIFQSIYVEKFNGNSLIGPANVNYRPTR